MVLRVGGLYVGPKCAPIGEGPSKIGVRRAIFDFSIFFGLGPINTPPFAERIFDEK